jgi:hypothetical protein
VKRKSPARLKSDLRDRLQPEADLATLANGISEFLHKHGGQRVNLAHNLAVYLTQQYSVSDRKSGTLRHLIEHHAEDLAAFLDGISFKEYRAIDIAQLPPSRKSIRAKPQTEAERAQRRKTAKNRYERRRFWYRDGLIERHFAKHTPPSALLDPNLSPLLSWQPTDSCLDILFRGGVVKMCGDWDSLENLFGVDRHRFPKSLPSKHRGRKVVYALDAAVECMIHLLANPDRYPQWLPEPKRRKIVLKGMIERARSFSSELANTLAGKLRPYLS